MGADAKKKLTRAAQRDRDDVAARREAFLAEVAAIPAERLAFVDESGVERGMRSAYGYARRGERCVVRSSDRTRRRRSGSGGG